MTLDYFIIGHLFKGGKPVCTCVAGREQRPGGRQTFWNMRGGLEYMREVEIYPCHTYPSIEAMQTHSAALYRAHDYDKPGESLVFKACEPKPVTI